MGKVKVVRRDLVKLSRALVAVGELPGIKFAYAVAKNADKIEQEQKALETGLKASKKFKEYEEERIELCKQHAERDEHKKPITRPLPVGPKGATEYAINDFILFEKDLAKLDAKYKEELDKRDKLKEEYEDELDKEIEFEYHMLKFEYIPESITGSQLKGIFVIIDGEPNDDKPVKKDKAKDA